MGWLEQTVQSSFEDFRQTLEKAKQVDIELNIIIPVIELPEEVVGLTGPLTESMIKKYLETHQITREKAEKYNSIMGNKWPNISQIVDKIPKEVENALLRKTTIHQAITAEEELIADTYSRQIAEELGIRPEEVADLYQLADYTFVETKDQKNTNQGSPIYRHKKTPLEQPTKVHVKYTTTKPFWRKQEHQEQLRYLGKDEFTNSLNQNEVNYIIYELTKRIKQLRQITITIPGIQEKTVEYKPEQLKQKITDYIRKQAA